MKKVILLLWTILLVLPITVFAREFHDGEYYNEVTVSGISLIDKVEYNYVSYDPSRSYATINGRIKLTPEYNDVEVVTGAFFYSEDFELIGTSRTSTKVYGLEEPIFYIQIKDDALGSGFLLSDIKYYQIRTIDIKPINKQDIFGYGDYALTKYLIEIIVNENNTFNITERITAHFNIDKHGIFRKLPLRNEVVRLDGTKSHNRAKISDIKVTGDQFSLYRENGYQVIKIGNPYETITGNKDYVITYLYDIGKDTGKGYDEFYFNLIGYEWDTSISGIEFKITMPKEFDSKLLGFSSGPKGATHSNDVIYYVDGNVITGKYNGTLNYEEALTIRLELPEGYFNGKTSYSVFSLLTIILPISFLLYALHLWSRYGKDDKVVETVEFYPPDGFNSAEVGFLYRGKAEDTDVVSLLIYLANKGYLKIVETEEKSLFTKSKNYKLVKLKEYDGNDENERIFLTGLFKGKLVGFESISEVVSYFKNPKETIQKLDEKNINAVAEVTHEDLYDSFYQTVGRITTNLNKKENREKILEPDSLNKSWTLVLMIIATYVLITWQPVVIEGDPFLLIPALLFPGIGFTILFGALFGVIDMPKWFAIIWGSGFGGMPWCFIVLPFLLYDPLYLIAYIVGIICVIGMLLCMKYMPKRTPYGNQILGQIKGFKNFLETAEKEKLEELVYKNPTYFYHILPYTYVLGVSDKWIKKFENITLRAPDWYSGTGSFNAAYFGSFISSTMTSASSAMTSSPSSGGGSGGGSSGGGSGGGGGGSW